MGSRRLGETPRRLAIVQRPAARAGLVMAHTLTSISIPRAIPRLRPHVGGSA